MPGPVLRQPAALGPAAHHLMTSRPASLHRGQLRQRSCLMRAHMAESGDSRAGQGVIAGGL
jgi:hypothetical protein